MTDLAHPDPSPRNTAFMIALHLADHDVESAEEQLTDLIAWLLFDKPRQNQAKANPIRVLIVDDVQDTANTECALFSHLGHAAVPALNGQEAIALAAMFSPDIVLLDVNAGSKALVERLRACRKSACIVGVSDEDHGMVTAQAAGCDLYLPKPIDLSKLRGMLVSAHQWSRP